jgi:hypothetical protein
MEKTLPLLLERKVKPADIYIFVADKAEYKKYEQIPKDKYNKLIIGKKGISYQRNFIIDYFKEGEHIVFIDDDISNIQVKRNNKVGDLTDLDAFFKKAFKALVDEGMYLWATKNMYNPFYKNLMRNDAVVGFREFSGDLIGIINRKSMKIKYTLKEGEGEQQELLFMYYEKDGGIIKYENVVVISRKLSPGGKISERAGRKGRIDSLNRNYKILLKHFPNLIDKIANDGQGYRTRAKLLIKQPPKDTEKHISGGKITDRKLLPVDDPLTRKVFEDKIVLTDKVRSLQEKIIQTLEQTRIPKIEGKRKDKNPTRGDLIGYKGYTFTLGCGRRRNLGIGEFSTNKRNPELLKLVIEYGNEILPSGFKYTAITINKNLKAKKHIDGGNAGIGCITFLGDYTGGGLFLYNPERKLYDTHNKVIAFNGANIAHMTQPFKGDRYAFIFYNQTDCKIPRFKMEGRGLDDGESLFNPVY